MLTQRDVRTAFDYSPEGFLTWRVRTSNRIKIGDRVGSVRDDGYLEASLNGEKYLVHRLVYLYHFGTMPLEVDHENRVRNDNRISNLRDASKSQNRHNRSMHPRNTSGVKGVCWDKDRRAWRAQICSEGRVRFLGRRGTIAEAEALVRDARELFHGRFANHG